MRPFHFILPALILLLVAIVDLSQRGAFDFLFKDNADAVQQEVRQELAVLQNMDLDSKLRELNKARQLQGLPTYNVH
jgi:hypothetical protein